MALLPRNWLNCGYSWNFLCYSPQFFKFFPRFPSSLVILTMINMKIYRTDQELLQEFAAGDSLALGHFYDRHITSLHAYIISLIQNKSLAEDLVHETFVGVIQRATTISKMKNPTAYIFQMARNKTLDYIRRLKTERKALEEKVQQVIYEWKQHPSQKDSKTIQIQKLQEILNQLSVEQLEILSLHIFSGKSFSQLGQILGITEHQSRYRYEKIIASLKEKFNEL